jgi:hypothetical protein
MPRVYDVNVTITNPKTMFTYLMSGSSANAFTVINAGVSGSGEGGVSLHDGALIKNLGANSLLIKTDDIDHGANTGYMLLQNESIFIEVNDISKLFIKNVVGGQGISFSVYSN